MKAQKNNMPGRICRKHISEVLGLFEIKLKHNIPSSQEGAEANQIQPGYTREIKRKLVPL